MVDTVTFFLRFGAPLHTVALIFAFSCPDSGQWRLLSRQVQVDNAGSASGSAIHLFKTQPYRLLVLVVSSLLNGTFGEMAELYPDVSDLAVPLEASPV